MNNEPIKKHGDLLKEALNNEFPEWENYYKTVIKEQAEKIKNLLARNKELQEWKDRARAEMEDAAEEVMDYLNISTPGGVPAEPTLGMAIRAYKEDAWHEKTLLKNKLDYLAGEVDRIFKFLKA